MPVALARTHVMTAVAFTALVTAGNRLACTDEIDLRLRGVAAFEDGRSSDTSFLSGISTLPPEDRRELLARSAASPGPVRLLVLFELARAGDEEAGRSLDSLLKGRGATLKLQRVNDLLGLQEMAWNGREKGQPLLQSLAAGLLLAVDGVSEDLSGLSRATRVLSGRKKGGTDAQAEARKAATHIGYLHLRGVQSATSQRELELALLDKDDPALQEIAAAFVGATGTPKSAKALLDALRDKGITSSSIFKRIARTLISNGAYTDQVRCALVPDLIKIVESLDLPDLNRHTARLVASRITGKHQVEEMLAWASSREKELAGSSPAGLNPAQAPVPEAGNPPASTPQEVQPPAREDAEVARCLLLAKNFMNMKEYAKAEENLKKVLEKSPEGKLADEARELLRKIEAVKGL